METAVLAPPQIDTHRPIASPWHMLLVLAVQGFLAFRGMMHANQMRAMVNPDRIGIYERTIFFEWLVFVAVIAGVWLSGSSLYTVLGERWRSLRQFFLDIGIGVLFLIASLTLDSILGPYLRGNAGDHAAPVHTPTRRCGEGMVGGAVAFGGYL